MHLSGTEYVKLAFEICVRTNDYNATYKADILYHFSSCESIPVTEFDIPNRNRNHIPCSTLNHHILDRLSISFPFLSILNIISSIKRKVGQ
jgi:hypothetical protein